MLTIPPQIAVYGIGSDLVFIPRIARIWQRFGQRFTFKILTEEERLLLPANPKHLPAYLAKRFAAKEAIAKALGTGLGAKFRFHDAQILKTPQGQPYALLSSRVHRLLNCPLQVHLSLTDEQDYALAFCLIEKQCDN